MVVFIRVIPCLIKRHFSAGSFSLMLCLMFLVVLKGRAENGTKVTDEPVYSNKF